MADEKEFVIIVKAKDLVKHTFKMATAKRFPNKYRFTIANRVCDLVLDIFQHVQEANELDISDPQEFRERQYEQKKALTECKTALFLVELSHECKRISAEQCATWSNYILDVKRMTAKWKKQDRERFAALQQKRGNAPRRSPGRFSWGTACSVQLLQRPQRQFLRRVELEQCVQRQQGRSPALVEHREMSKPNG